MEFLGALKVHAESKEGQQFCVWLNDAGEEVDSRTFGQLWSRAWAGSVFLKESGVSEGDHVVLCYNFGLSFLDAFVACLLIRAVPVPIYPPDPSDPQKSLSKMQLIVEDSGSKVVLLGKDVCRFRRMSAASWPSSCVYLVLPDSLHPHQTCQITLPGLSQESPAFIQYTSGSTGDPKGVVLTFRNLLANFDLMRTSHARDGEVGNPADLKFCSWLPQFHDLGLIYCTLWPLFEGGRAVYLSPRSFIKRPLLWLDVIARHQCTTTAAPNFAYGLVTRRLHEQRSQVPTLDLSCVLNWTCAAEPNRPDTLHSFASSFAPFCAGGKFILGYGLAEHTVFVSALSISIQRPKLRDELLDRSGRFVVCGDLALTHGLVDTRIVDPLTRFELPDGTLGEVWVRSASASKAYWQMPQKSLETFHAELAGTSAQSNPVVDSTGAYDSAGFLRTGEEGVIEVDERTGRRCLYYCGRIKDLIIIRGRNVYPQDVERSVEKQTSVRPNCTAAFQATDEDGAELPALSLVCELRSCSLSNSELESIARGLARELTREFSCHVRHVVLLKPRRIPKTTSGKIRRKATQQALRDESILKHALMVFEDVREHAAADPENDGDAGEVGAQTANMSVLQTIVHVLQNEFGIADVDPEQDLSSLGLDSLMMVQLCEQLSALAARQIGPHLLFQADTLRSLAADIEELRKHPSDSEHTTSVSAEVSVRMKGHPEGNGRDEQPPADESFVTLTDAYGGDQSEEMEAQEGEAKEAMTSRVRRHLTAMLLGFVHLGCHVAVLCLVSLCVLAGAFVFELLAHPNTLQTLRLTRFRLRPNFLDSVQISPRQHSLSFDAGATSSTLGSLHLSTVVAAMAAGATALLTLLATTIATKWLLLGRCKPTQIPVWGARFWLRWMVQQLVGFSLSALALVLPDGQVLALLYSCLGARIGRDCTLSCPVTEDWDLLTVGDNTTVSASAALITGVVADGVLTTAPITLGAGCVIQDKAAVMPHCSLPPRTLVAMHAVVSPATCIPATGCELRGKPARVVPGKEFAGGGGVGGLVPRVGVPLAWLSTLAAIAAACVATVVELDQHAPAQVPGWQLPLWIMAYMGLFWLSFAALTVLLKWTLLGRLAPGTVVPPGSWLRVRREVVHRLADAAFRMVWNRACFSPLQRWWFTLLGASVHRDAILANGVKLTDFDSVHIGARALVGGGALIKTSHPGPDGEVIAGMRIEADASVGSETAVHAGCHVGRYAFVGSRSCVGDKVDLPPFSASLGTQRRLLRSRCFVPGESRPSGTAGSLAAVIVSISVFLVGTYWSWLAGLWLVWALGDSLWALFLVAPAVALSLSAGAVSWLLVTKWCVIGRYRAHDGHKMLSGFGLQYNIVMHSASHTLLFGPLNHWLQGGPLYNFVLCALGASVDPEAFVGTNRIFDFDLVRIGRHAAINAGAILAPHLISDTLTCGFAPLHVADGACIWPHVTVYGRHTVLPGTHVGPQSVPAQMPLAARSSGHGGTVTVLIGVPATEAVDVPLCPVWQAAHAVHSEVLPSTLASSAGAATDTAVVELALSSNF